MTATVKAQRGRPRDEAAERAIVEATKLVLRARGYAGLSIEAVARESGVAKTTIYRRWSSKAALVFDVVFGSMKRKQPKLSGDLQRDLAQAVLALCEQFRAPEARVALPSLLAEFMSDASLRSQLERTVLGPERAFVQQILRDAQRRGDMRTRIDQKAVLDGIIGPVFYRMVEGGDLDARFARSVARNLVEGVGARA